MNRFLILLLVTLVSFALPRAAEADEPYGKIGEKYQKIGGRNSYMGSPIGAESDAPHGGRHHIFKNGMIYWHPQIGEAFFVWGEIWKKYFSLGSTLDYGYPITDEMTTPDGRGRYNHFRRMDRSGELEASIYWTPETGAHAVYGLIRQKWAESGWERGPCGYPTSDEFQEGNFRRSNFERCHILWSPATGAQIVISGTNVVPASPPGQFQFGTIMVTGMQVALEGQRLAGHGTFLSENFVCGTLDDNRRQINAWLLGELRNLANTEGSLKKLKTSIHSSSEVRVSEKCAFRAEISTACGDIVRLRLNLPRNLVILQFTTPTPLGSGADPRFSMDFDLSASMLIRLPKQGGQPIGLSDVDFTVSGVKVDSQSPTADFILSAFDFGAYLIGFNWKKALHNALQGVLDGISAPLNQLNYEMPKIPGNYRVESCMINGSQLQINGTSAPEPAGPIVR